MSQVTQAASFSLTKLFGTIAVTANAISTAVEVGGSVFDVAHVKSTDWLKNTRKKSIITEEHQELMMLDECQTSIATRLNERKKQLDQDPTFRDLYNEVGKTLRAKLEEARSKGQI